MKNIIEIQHLLRKSNIQSRIKKISAEQYIVIDTGEILDYKKSENRSQAIQSFKRTTKKIRSLINTNFDGSKNEIMVTLTYAENMTDTKKLYKDVEKFIKSFKRKHPDLLYISVIEPQERGAWHSHILIKDKTVDNLYVPFTQINEWWKHGSTDIKRLNNCDNIGSYLSAYLADVELPPNQLPPPSSEIKECTFEDGTTKRFIKGGRVHLYPVGMNILRHSNNIEFPKSEMKTYEKAKKNIPHGMKPTYTKKVTITENDGTTLVQEIQIETYNLKRNAQTNPYKAIIETSVDSVN